MKFEEYFYNTKPVTGGELATKIETAFAAIEGSYDNVTDEELSPISRKLLSFCHRVGIPVHRITESSTKVFLSGECDYAVIGFGEEVENMNDKRVDLAFAHEIGHFLDYRYAYKSDTREIVNGCMVNFEVVAWAIAVEMLYNLGFNEWEYAYKHIESCLDTYVDYYGIPQGFTMKGTIDYYRDFVNELSKNDSVEAAEKL